MSSDCRESPWEMRSEAMRKATRSLVDNFEDAMAIFTEQDRASIRHEDPRKKIEQVERVVGRGKP